MEPAGRSVHAHSIYLKNFKNAKVKSALMSCSQVEANSSQIATCDLRVFSSIFGNGDGKRGRPQTLFNGHPLCCILENLHIMDTRSQRDD